MSKYKVSFYSNMFKPFEGQIIDVESFLNDIKTQKYKAEIENLRTFLTLDNKEQYKKEKVKLVSITPSGTFLQRAEKGLLEHSNILSIDFDNLDNPAAAKQQIIKEKWVMAAFISPSNNGLKVFVKIEATQHKQAFQSLKEHFTNTYQINSDKGCSDVTRLCFVSSDIDIYINLDCEVYQPITTPINQDQVKPKKTENQNTAPGPKTDKNTEQIIFEVETITQRIEQSKIDICPTYEDWRKLGFALASIGETGRNFFYRISSQYSGEITTTAEHQFNECVKQRKAGVNIQSFFFLAKAAGVNVVVQTSLDKQLKTETIEPTTAIKNKFWNVVFKVNSDGTKQFKGVEIDKLNFLSLLFSFGYRRFDINNGFSFVKVQNNIVQEVQTQHIQDNFLDYVKALPDKPEKQITKQDLHRKALNNLETLFGKTLLSTLRNDRDFEFNTDKKNESFVYYKNGFVKCFAGNYTLHPYTQLQRSIWKERIINRDFKVLPKGESGNFDKFIFNVSGKNQDRYISLMSLIGYLLHDFTEGKMKAVVLTDSKISDDNEGRTGKTLFGKALKHIRNVCELSGKDFKADNKFKYQDCQLSTQVLFLNDAKQYFNLETLYTDITEGVTIEKKNQSPLQLKLKYLITTNKTIKTKGASSKDRVIEFEFSEHYSELYSPEQEFKQWFFRDWNIDEWNNFDNFMVTCISLYLENGVIEVTPVNLLKRKMIDETCKEFYDFILSGEIKPKIEFTTAALLERFKYLNPHYDFYKADEMKRFVKWIKSIPDYLKDFQGYIFEHSRKTVDCRFYIFNVKVEKKG